MADWRDRIAWLLRANLTELVLSCYFIVLGFNFVVLGARPGRGTIEEQMSFSVQLMLNLALLIFGLVSFTSFVWPDAVVRKLLRAFANIGLAGAVVSYWLGFLATFGWERASLSLTTFVALFCITSGTAIQSLLTLRTVTHVERIERELDVSRDELRRLLGVTLTPDPMEHDAGVKEDGSDSGTAAK